MTSIWKRCEESAAIAEDKAEYRARVDPHRLDSRRGCLFVCCLCGGAAAKEDEDRKKNSTDGPASSVHEHSRLIDNKLKVTLPVLVPETL